MERPFLLGPIEMETATGGKSEAPPPPKIRSRNLKGRSSENGEKHGDGGNGEGSWKPSDDEFAYEPGKDYGPPPKTFEVIRYRNIKPTLSGQWIIKGLVPARGLMTIFGEPGCGKSFFVLDMAMHIAAPLDYLGRQGPARPRDLYRRRRTRRFQKSRRGVRAQVMPGRNAIRSDRGGAEPWRERR